jgi:ParB-like chromosome segregation protein Spo0J
MTNTEMKKIAGLEKGVLLRVPVEAVEVHEDANSRQYTNADIATLAQEILETGQQLQPVGFVPGGGSGLVRLVYGYRRYKAIRQLVESGKIPPESPLSKLEGRIVTSTPGDGELGERDLFELNVRENTNRLELSPIDQAYALKRMVDEFGYNLTQAAATMGRKKAWASQTMSLLRLPADVQKKIHTGAVAVATGYELARLEPEQLQSALQMLGDGDYTRTQAREVMRGMEDGGAGEGEDQDNITAMPDDLPEKPAKSNLVRPRTMKEWRMFLVDWMARVEATVEEGQNPLEESPRYALFQAILNWLDGKGGRGADKKLRKAFETAIPEVGDEG